MVDDSGPVTEQPTLEQDLASVLNRHCIENESNTPDFILADYLRACLSAFKEASRRREQWYGKELSIGGSSR